MDLTRNPCRSWISAAARCAWPWGRSAWVRSTRCRCPPPSRPTSTTSDATAGTTSTTAPTHPGANSLSHRRAPRPGPASAAWKSCSSPPASPAAPPDTDCSGHGPLCPPSGHWQKFPACRITAPSGKRTQRINSYTELRSALGVAWVLPHLPGPTAPRVDPGGAKRCLDEGRCPPSGAAAPDEAQDVRSSPWPPRQKPNLDLPQAREHPASVLAVGAPVPRIYSFNNNKSHLFIPFRKDTLFGSPLSGVFCCFSSACPSLGCVCLTWPFRWVVSVVCPHVGTGVSLFGSLDLQFPRGSAPSARVGP
ncbi:SPRY domain-containing SOCS box protein 1 isoform X1 [Balaenoptera ricei]|uniref:SPRY domain-containing SOCS box protein 1 isoform X1 n=1 Tax=Balaenoptera ricei TaxID=2746895 RepID=UPI0028BDBF98|nr:SPRY domain-containing SOCS box protein 1 isoform X1 [Balaenoptera ricei]